MFASLSRYSDGRVSKMESCCSKIRIDFRFGHFIRDKGLIDGLFLYLAKNACDAEDDSGPSPSAARHQREGVICMKKSTVTARLPVCLPITFCNTCNPIAVCFRSAAEPCGDLPWSVCNRSLRRNHQPHRRRLPRPFLRRSPHRIQRDNTLLVFIFIFLSTRCFYTVMESFQNNR